MKIGGDFFPFFAGRCSSAGMETETESRKPFLLSSKTKKKQKMKKIRTLGGCDLGKIAERNREWKMVKNKRQTR